MQAETVNYGRRNPPIPLGGRMAPKHKLVKLKDLKTTFFIRTGLDQDHVIKLSELYEGGKSLPPIKITPNNEVIDGRHRIEALELAFNKDHEIEAEVIVSKDPVELIVMAFQANEGGALPNSRADTIHTLQMLLTRGASERSIYEYFSNTPRAVVRKWLEPAKRNLKRSLIQQGKEAVASGEGSVKEVAKKFGLDVNDLKTAIAGPKVGVDSHGLAQMKSSISSRFYAVSRANQAMVKRLIVGFADGEVNEKVVNDVLEHLEHSLTSQKRRLKDWRSRFEAAKQGKLINWNDISQGFEEGETAA
jgi:hypothetical protein